VLVYDVKIEDTSGNVSTVEHGFVAVVPNVTRSVNP
jgi:hypothetical protein